MLQSIRGSCGLSISTFPAVPTAMIWPQRWEFSHDVLCETFIACALFVCVICINARLLLLQQWREFAKEMDGVIRIGAVNCGDNGRLCRSKGVTSYPSLYMFKAGMVRLRPVYIQGAHMGFLFIVMIFIWWDASLPNRMRRSTLETGRKRAWPSLPCSLWRAGSLSFGKVSTMPNFCLHVHAL